MNRWQTTHRSPLPMTIRHTPVISPYGRPTTRRDDVVPTETPVLAHIRISSTVAPRISRMPRISMEYRRWICSRHGGARRGTGGSRLVPKACHSQETHPSNGKSSRRRRARSFRFRKSAVCIIDTRGLRERPQGLRLPYPIPSEVFGMDRDDGQQL